jgi:N-methylhydantoinase A/oxoprolinase/acetone carboxylase beta subunit
LLLSGPAGGVRAAAAAASACGHADAVSFDMGGTSTDVCLIRAGVPAPASTREVAGFPIRFPSLDILTIGAGGGSIARLDSGGALVVGPESSGADPGPACYGRGGTEPTVTDADLVLGRIPAGTEFPGLGRLDVDAARAAIDRAGLTAEGIVRVVDANMERAVRVVTVERGVDARELVLVAFGGAGPLHACAVADALEMRAVLVPPRAGVLSAVGLVSAPPQRELVRSWPEPTDHAGIPAARAALGREAAALDGLAGIEVDVETFLDCRYAGQSHELTVTDIEEFPAEHARRNGYARPDIPIEVVAIRARARGVAALDPAELPPWPREPVVGPAVAAEPDCTVWVPAGWTATVAPDGTWVLTQGGS